MQPLRPKGANKPFLRDAVLYRDHEESTRSGRTAVGRRALECRRVRREREQKGGGQKRRQRRRCWIVALSKKGALLRLFRSPTRGVRGDCLETRVTIRVAFLCRKFFDCRAPQGHQQDYPTCFFLPLRSLSSLTRRRFCLQRSSSGLAVVTGVVPSPPRYVPLLFVAHSVQHSHCSSIFIECS